MKKREREMMSQNYLRWQNETASELWEVYGTYSNNKRYSYDRWKGRLYEKGFHPHRYRILSANSQVYTFGCEGTDPFTGQIIFIWVTPSYVRIADITENGLENFRYW